MECNPISLPFHTLATKLKIHQSFYKKMRLESLAIKFHEYQFIPKKIHHLLTHQPCPNNHQIPGANKSQPFPNFPWYKIHAPSRFSDRPRRNTPSLARHTHTDFPSQTVSPSTSTNACSIRQIWTALQGHESLHIGWIWQIYDFYWAWNVDCQWRWEMFFGWVFSRPFR